MHVFISHNSADRALVEPLVRRLVSLRHTVIFDEWTFVAGDSWLTVIEQAIAAADAVLVVVGPSGIGRVQRQEIELALVRKWNADDTLRMVTVLLPGAQDIEPGFLTLTTWVDFRGRTERSWRKLVDSLHGAETGPPQYAGAPCPYPGLAAFTPSDAALFFGRDAQTDALVDRLEEAFAFVRPRMLTLIGASGVGKSSLLHAGLLPTLQARSTRWLIARCRPGAHPLKALCVAIARACAVGSLAAVAELADASAQTPQALIDWFALHAPSDEHRLLIVIDQLEEALVQCPDPSVRAVFFGLLSHLADAKAPVAVVAALRADFLAPALQVSNAFARTVQATQSLLVGLSPAGLKAAICRPAIERGRRIDAALVETLIETVAERPADLPLLQFMLARLWASSPRSVIDGQDYLRLGGLEGALTRYADEVVHGLRDRLDVVRQLMCALVHLVDGAPHTRRRLSRQQLLRRLPDCEPVIDALVAHRLLALHDDGVEVIHEALIRRWDRLADWIEADRVRLRALQALEVAAGLWSDRGQSDDDLWRGARLEGAERLVAGERLEPMSQAFLDAARAARDARREAEATAAAELQRAHDEAQRRLADAVDVAELIHSTASRELTRTHDLPRVRRALIEAARALLERLGTSGDPAVDRTFMVNLLEQGEIELTHGAIADARACFVRAHEIAVELARDPDDLVAAFDILVALSHLARVADAAGEPARAIAVYRQSLAMGEELLRRWPDDLDLLSSKADDQSKLATALAAQGETDEALQLALAALAGERDIAASTDDPDAHRAVAIALGGLARVHRDRGEVHLADARLAEAERLDRAAVSADPEDPAAQRDLSITLGDRARIALEEGRLAPAAVLAEEALALDAARADADGDDRSVMDDLVHSRRLVASIWMRLGRRRDARRLLERAWRAVEPAIDDAPALEDSALSLLHLTVENAIVMGEVDEARAAIDMAVTIARRIVDRAPDSAQAQHTLAMSLDQQGDLHRAEGAQAEALEAFAEVWRILTRITADGGPFAYQRNRTAAEIKYGQALIAAGRTAQARSLLEASLQTRIRLVEASAQSAHARRDLSIAHNAMGQLALTERAFDAACEHFAQAVEVDRALLAESEADALATRDLAISLQDLGDALRRVDARVKARRCYVEAADLMRALLSAAPDDMRALRDLSGVLERLGDLSVLANEPDVAVGLYREAVAIDRAHHAAEPSDGTARDLAISLERLGAGLIGTGDWTEAQSVLRESYTMRAGLVERHPDTVGLHRELSVSQRKLLIVLGRQGHIAEARQIYEDARERLERALARWPADPGLASACEALDAEWARLRDESAPD